MKRKIVSIDETKCNGCGLCVAACHEGAIEIIDGKAKLVSDEYCDGLGNCLPECPTGAIQIIEREAAEFNEEAVRKRMMGERKKGPAFCGCPGAAAKRLERPDGSRNNNVSIETEEIRTAELKSELRQWPVQLNLINVNADYLEGADLLIAADCTAYAYANFHKDFIKGRITLIGCPKLDDCMYYEEKLTEILRNHDIRSITVVRMEVPCCSGITHAVKSAMLNSKVIVPYREIVISTEGDILS
ncbi:MAG TPA: 4Fe-4S binding protein [Thermoanaerobacterales bacterium]|nr:4Fe-4S binding protein [Thermoanaerobacterales bacterium]